jgi:hypothetical protein
MRNTALALLLLYSATAWPQIQDSLPAVSNQDLLRKSKGQNTAAIVLFTTGSALFVTGVALALDDLGGLFDPADKDNTSASEICMISGAVIAASSVPFYIASRRNRREASELSGVILMEKWQGPKISSAINRNFPSVGIRLNF